MKVKRPKKEKVKLPDDYETCAHCGYDHGYEYSDAKEYHLKNPSSEDLLNESFKTLIIQ